MSNWLYIVKQSCISGAAMRYENGFKLVLQCGVFSVGYVVLRESDSVPRHSILLSSQFFKCKYRGRDHMTQSIQKQVGTFPAVEAESHLIQVGGEMLWANSVPCTDDATL